MSHVVSAEIVANVLSVPVEAGPCVSATHAVIVGEPRRMRAPGWQDDGGTVTEAVVAGGDGRPVGDPRAVVAETR